MSENTEGILGGIAFGMIIFSIFINNLPLWGTGVGIMWMIVVEEAKRND